MSDSLAERVTSLDWPALVAGLNERGFARTGQLLSAAEAASLAALFDEKRLFRRRIIMKQHGYGAGRYRYFDYPLPPQVQSLHTAFYRHLAPIAQAWAQALDLEQHYPETLTDYLTLCHRAG